MSIASELKALKNDVAAIKAAPVPTPMIDMTDIHNAINDLNTKMASLTALVGTSDELNPPA